MQYYRLYSGIHSISNYIFFVSIPYIISHPKLPVSLPGLIFLILHELIFILLVKQPWPVLYFETTIPRLYRFSLGS